jgi:hypothetical protein
MYRRVANARNLKVFGEVSPTGGAGLLDFSQDCFCTVFSYVNILLSFETRTPHCPLVNDTLTPRGCRRPDVRDVSLRDVRETGPALAAMSPDLTVTSGCHRPTGLPSAASASVRVADHD